MNGQNLRICRYHSPKFDIDVPEVALPVWVYHDQHFELLNNYLNFIYPNQLCDMSLQSSLLAMFVICSIPLTTVAQSDLFALNPPPPSHTLKSNYSQNRRGRNPHGERVVSIPVNLYTESEVKIQVKDALGMKRFESEGTYPEGKREIRIGMGSMDQGLYFVRVSTFWEEKTEIIIVERIH